MYNPLLLARYHPQIPTVTIYRRIDGRHLCVRLYGLLKHNETGIKAKYIKIPIKTYNVYIYRQRIFYLLISFNDYGNSIK